MFQFMNMNQYYPNNQRQNMASMDFGPQPFTIDIKKATMNNENFRIALWTGDHLQLTLMCIPVGADIGLEVHQQVDQFLCIEDGQGIVRMGDTKDHLCFEQPVFNESVIFVPAGTWHNVVNIGNRPLKLYSIYAPADHPWGIVHPTKEIAESMEHK